jgi:hypothetical protein
MSTKGVASGGSPGVRQWPALAIYNDIIYMFGINKQLSSCLTSLTHQFVACVGGYVGTIYG